MSGHSDINEKDILAYDETLLQLLLVDRTRSEGGEMHNIFWATDNYA